MRRLRDLPSLDLLKGFESAARHLSFTRAADELFLTQSAVSRQVKALEDHLGVPLFKRDSRTLVLTDAGRLLHATAIDILAALDDAVSRIVSVDIDRRLTVTTTVSFASVWLVPRLPQFRQMFPDIDVHLVASNDLANLERSHIDLAIRMLEPAAAPPDATRLVGDMVFPVCSPQLVRDRDRPLKSPADLARHVLLHFDDAAGRWPSLTWPHWLANNGLANLRAAGSVGFNQYDHVIQAVIAGEGIALGRTPLVNDLLRMKRLVAPFEQRIPSGREYFVVVSPAARERAAVGAFVEWLQQEIVKDGAP